MAENRTGQTALPAAPPRRGRGGFTLVEMLAVILVIGIIVAVVVGVAGNALAKANEAETRQIMTAIDAVITAYYDAKGVYPGANLYSELRDCPQSKIRLGALSKVIKNSQFLDGFKQPIRYRTSGGAGGAPYLESAGRDGDIGSKDDNIRSDNM